MKNQLLTCLMAFSIGAVAMAQTTYEQDGIVYTLYDDYAEVSNNLETLPSTVIIPSTIKNGNVEYPVTSIADKAFFKSNIENLEIPESVKTIGEFAFTGSTQLKTVNLPSSVTDIGICAFRSCLSLKGIQIPESVAHIGGGAFTCCGPVTVSADNPNYTVVDGVLFNKDMTTILSYPVNAPQTYTIPSTVTTIDDWTFFNTYLKSIVIPPSVTTIGNSVFIWCDFTNVEIPSSVTTIGNAAFNWCTSLKSIEIPSSVTSIGNEAFRYCHELEKATVPSSVTYIGQSAFEGCELLADVDFEACISEIGYGMFRECKSLKAITIPSTVTSIGKSAFLECESLTSLYLPASVTNIGNYAFSKCRNLKTIELSPNLKTIRSDAFTHCEALTDVIYLTTEPIYCNKDIFSDATYENATLTLAEGGIEKIDNTVPWKYFLHLKEEIHTGVDSINLYEDVETEVFTIDGRYVTDSVENLGKGMYVVRRNNKGQKIIVK